MLGQKKNHLFLLVLLWDDYVGKRNGCLKVGSVILTSLSVLLIRKNIGFRATKATCAGVPALSCILPQHCVILGQVI